MGIHRIYLSIIGGLVVLNIAILYHHNQVKANFSPRLNRQTQVLYAELLREYEDGCQSFEDIELTGLDGEKDYLSNILDQGPKLFFRFKETDCSSCVDKEISLLKNHFSENPDRVVILVTFSELRILQLMSKKYDIPFKIFNIENHFDQNLTIRQANKPYYFLGDSDFLFKLIYEVKNLPEKFTLTYFKVVNRRLEYFIDEK